MTLLGMQLAKLEINLYAKTLLSIKIPDCIRHQEIVISRPSVRAMQGRHVSYTRINELGDP